MLLVFYIYTFQHLNLIRSQLNLVWAKNLPKPAWLYYCRLVYFCSCYINLGLVNQSHPHAEPLQIDRVRHHIHHSRLLYRVQRSQRR